MTFQNHGFALQAPPQISFHESEVPSMLGTAGRVSDHGDRASLGIVGRCQLTAQYAAAACRRIAQADWVGHYKPNMKGSAP